MNEQAKSRLQAVIRGASTLAETIEVVAEKVVNIIDEFAVGVERQIDKVEEAERAEAMQRHPAGKGRVDNNTLTRAEKIKVVQDFLSHKDGTWHTNPDSISDTMVDWGYDFVLKQQEKV